MTPIRQRQAAVLVMATVLLAGWLAYSPGLGGGFLLDDASNLGGLEAVEHGASPLNFILSGSAGPLGRPLALATFVPQASAWGESPAAFLTVNILLHLFNAVLLAWVLYALTMARGIDRRNALFATIAAVAFWLFMPLLASSSLMIVQRMTTLSASFVLLGLLFYLQARRVVDRRPGLALAAMSSSIVVCTMLASFSKENGALLPTLVLVMEATLLPRPTGVRSFHWKAWAGVFLVLPTVFLIGYLVAVVPYSTETLLHRDFGGWQRLLTEARILWLYLLNAFLPMPGSFGPFHDDYPVAGSLLDPVTFMASAGLVAAIALAAVQRRQRPLLSFSILWFVAGHLLESTVIPLELYFEHRNYVPIIGPVYAVAIVLSRIKKPGRRLAYGGFAAYLALNAAVLVSVTSTWGDPARAAEHWHRQSPGSVRASTNLATIRLQQQGPLAAALSLRNLVRGQPQAGYVKIQELNLACIGAPQERHLDLLEELSHLLPRVDFSATTGTMLSQLFSTIVDGRCRDVDTDTVRALAIRLLENPRYKNNSRYMQLHHQLMARMDRYQGKYRNALEQLKKAEELGASSRLNMMMVTTLLDSKDFDGAYRYIAQAYENQPLNPMARIVWLNDLRELKRYAEIVEASPRLKEAN